MQHHTLRRVEAGRRPTGATPPFRVHRARDARPGTGHPAGPSKPGVV